MSSPGPDIVARLSAGQSIDTIMFSLLPADLRRTLMRCAALRTFDGGLYRAVLQEPDGPALDALLDRRYLEPARGGDGEFRAVGMREPAFTAWWGDEGRPAVVASPVPKELAEFAARLAGEQRRRGRRRATLDALLLCDPDAAAELLAHLYAEADRRDDLAGCQDVLDVLDEPDRLPLLSGTALAARRDGLRAYVAARTLWAGEFAKSARYFPRPRAERWLTDLISRPHGRVLQLYARGGMGKTMQLRWFLARHCVPAPRRIPCARIDFDTEDARRATRDPWLLLLKIAEQFEPQLVGEHFQPILDNYGAFTPLLYPSTNSTNADGAAGLPPETDAVDGNDIVDRFVSVLAEQPAGSPALVVIDTCEELLRPGIDAAGLFEMLAEVVRRVPALRLVLAGRYQLAGHEALNDLGCDLRRLFPGLRTERVRGFTKLEQERYLEHTRGIRDPAIRNAIRLRARGTPFHLSTFADLVRHDPGITAEEIRSAEGPSMLYCIERILKRVEDDVRWLLFYGVVPRRLSLDFVKRVMRPFLIDGMRQAGGHGQPPEGGLPLRQVAPPSSDADLDDLWSRLRGYAARYSWVWSEPDGTVRFHDDVIEPLRGLARERSFYGKLHRAAIGYYEERAASDQERWAEWTCETLFHRFQLDGSQAEGHWRETVRQLRKRARPGWLLTVASEPLRREYLDEQARPRMFDGEPIVSWQTVAEAHIYCGWALADDVPATFLPVRSLPTGASRRSQWADVEMHLRAATQIHAKYDVQLPQPETPLLRARLALAAGRASDAQGMLEQYGPGAAAAMSREAGRLYRLALHQQGRDDAWSGFAATLRDSDPGDDPAGAQRSAVTLANTSAERGRFAAALEWVVRAREISGTQDQAGYLLQNHVALLCSNGRYHEAKSVAEEATGGLAEFARAFALLACARPRDALGSANEASPRALAGAGPVDQTADLLALRALAGARLLQFDDARANLHAAVAYARRYRDADSAAYYAALSGIIQVRGVGDLRNAAALLHDAEEAEAPPDCHGWLAARLGMAELLARKGRPQDALNVINEARKAAVSIPSAIAVAVCELVVSRGGTSRAVRSLIRGLEAVDPPVAALILLADFTEVDPLSAVSPGERDGLRGAALAGLNQPHTRDDAALLALLAAEVHRVTDHRDDARRLLEEAVRPAAAGNPYLWWCWLEAMQRCGPARPGEPPPPDDPFTEYGAFPGLRAAWLIRLVEHRGHLESPSWASARLHQAASLLADATTLPSRWRAKLDEELAAFGRRETDQRSASQAAATASATWATLGNEYKRRQLASEFVLGEAKPLRDEATVELRLGAGGDGKQGPLGISWVVRFSDGAEQTPAPLDLQPLIGSARPNLNSRLRAVSRRIADDMHRWGATVGSRFTEIPQLAGALAAADGSYDARFVCLDNETAALPWELIALPEGGGAPISLRRGTTYRCLPSPARDDHKLTAAQAALRRLGYLDAHPDGLMGARTQEAIRSFQRSVQLVPDGALSMQTWRRLRGAIADSAGRRPLRVLVLHADTDTDAFGAPGIRLCSADVAAAYRSRGAHVTVLNVRDIARRVAGVLRLIDEAPDVVHAQLGVELAGGAVVLDARRLAGASPASWAAEPVQLPVTVFSDLANVLSLGSFGPMIVLETPWLRSKSESVRAVLLRNAFGHRLLELGRTVAVLCTGGGSPQAQHALYGVLADGMVSRLDIAEITGRLRRQYSPGREAVGDAVPSLASALFLQRSPYSLFPVGCA